MSTELTRVRADGLDLLVEDATDVNAVVRVITHDEEYLADATWTEPLMPVLGIVKRVLRPGRTVSVCSGDVVAIAGANEKVVATCSRRWRR
jgi:hypothetical protein